MADGITTEHELPHAHHGGVMGALRDMPKWGWFAIGGAVLILVLWKMRGSGSSGSATAAQPAQGATPTDPGAVPVGGGSPTPDNTDAILSGFQAIEQQNQQALSDLMQQQNDAIGAALDASTQQQVAALQGLSDAESGFSSMLSNILGAVQSLSSNPVVSNPGTTGDGNPGSGVPTGIPPVTGGVTSTQWQDVNGVLMPVAGSTSAPPPPPPTPAPWQTAASAGTQVGGLLHSAPDLTYPVNVRPHLSG